MTGFVTVKFWGMLLSKWICPREADWFPAASVTVKAPLTLSLVLKVMVICVAELITRFA